MSSRLQTILILIGFVAIASSVTFLKDFNYKQYFQFAGVILMGIGFMYGSDSDKIKKKD
ncbi:MULTISPECIES: hypothetical protein [unclassified Bacillus (in: firmicutes)]|uniref:hypothetical protein n=1 Tax=unclassified Bacillus (in: firmicutes) TaxID=185979 RepID=UPI001596E290|nr:MULTISPECIES: hypothetical protein [unclassified Bacillus (in: firmicutes)]